MRGMRKHEQKGMFARMLWQLSYVCCHNCFFELAIMLPPPFLYLFPHFPL